MWLMQVSTVFAMASEARCMYYYTCQYKAPPMRVFAHSLDLLPHRSDVVSNRRAVCAAVVCDRDRGWTEGEIGGSPELTGSVSERGNVSMLDPGRAW